jgi:hypothetical protein
MLNRSMAFIRVKVFSKDALNLVSLGATQALNAVFPLLVFPFALHKVGVARFSDIVWTESVALVCLTIVLYSFDVDGIRNLVDLEGENQSKRAKLFYDIFWARILILLFCASFILVGFYWMLPGAVALMSCWLLFVLGHILHSAWFFLGIGRNVFVALVTVASRTACVAFLLLKLSDADDYLKVPLLIGLSYFASGALSFLYANIAFSMRPTWIHLRDVLLLIRRGRHIFSGNLSVLLFRGSNVLLLKLMSAEAAVSIYALAEKVVKCVQAAVRPVNQFVYPKLVARLRTLSSGTDVRPILWSYTVPQMALLAGTFLALILVAISLQHRQFLVDFIPAGWLIVVMAIATFFGVANYMYGTAGMTALDMDRAYARAIMLTGLISLAFGIGLIAVADEMGAALAYVLGEVVLFGQVLRILAKTNEGRRAPP